MQITSTIKNNKAKEFYNTICRFLPIAYQVEIKNERRKLSTIFLIEVENESQQRTIKNIEFILNR